MQWLIVTDLDGTLLDDTYPIAEAAKALSGVQIMNTPTQLVLASSKTLQEMFVIAEAAVKPVILIFENGAGIAWPKGTIKKRGDSSCNGYQIQSVCRPYSEVRTILSTLRREGYRFLGFGDMTVTEIALKTGLSPFGAALSKKRLMSEPIQWLESDERLNDFAARLAEHDLTLQLGGRFHHVSSGATKGNALKHLTRMITTENGEPPRILACGDAPNDLEMLNYADEALLFPQKQGGYLKTACKHTYHAPCAGPESWLAGVKQVLLAQGDSA